MNIPALVRPPPRPCDMPMGSWQDPKPVAWDRAPGEPSIAEGEVHVWAGGLRADEAHLEACRSTISDAESARAARFFGSRDRDRYVAGRGALREILSRYTGISPREISLCVDRWGKPALASGVNSPPVQFSIGHSGNLLLVAVTVHGQVGVDVERMDQTLDWIPVAEVILSRSERIALRGVPAVHRRSAFYSLWTQWEALSKAIGCGLSLPRDTVVPAQAGGNLIGRRDNLWEGPEGGLWRARIFTPHHGYVAALAHRSHSASQVKFYLSVRPPWIVS
ncbi:MAG: 4'-phosphopantetheinyl transferase [Anaerolineales bacterium]|nr:4'-phosphopantetheinyl transferase [Anaerolineales bacterium]